MNDPDNLSVLTPGHCFVKKNDFKRIPEPNVTN